MKKLPAGFWGGIAVLTTGLVFFFYSMVLSVYERVRAGAGDVPKLDFRNLDSPFRILHLRELEGKGQLG